MKARAGLMLRVVKILSRTFRQADGHAKVEVKK